MAMLDKHGHFLFCYTVFMFFKLFKAARQIKNGTFNAHDFAGDEAGDLATGVLDIPIIILGVLALFCVIFGFTGLWFGPVIILGFLGVILAIILGIAVLIKRFVTRVIKNYINKHK